MWIAVYDTANKFLTGNGGEFANSEFRPPWHYHTCHRCKIYMEQ